MARDRSDKLLSLARTRVALVSDALDRLGFRRQAIDPSIERLNPGGTLAGRAVPILVESTDRLSESPYSSEMRAIESLAPGDIPVYAVEDGVRAALWGELFACAARGRGAVGAVLDAYVRDAEQLGALGFPVYCRGCSPLDTNGRAEVTAIGDPVTCGGVRVNRGDLVIGDHDGVVVIPEGSFDDVLELVGRRLRDEQGALADLLAGVSIQDVWTKWKVL
jgi:regulator of RNase E activity RraA